MEFNFANLLLPISFYLYVNGQTCSEGKFSLYPIDMRTYLSSQMRSCTFETLEYIYSGYEPICDWGDSLSYQHIQVEFLPYTNFAMWDMSCMYPGIGPNGEVIPATPASPATPATP